jgi:hypothetical protein
VKHGGRQCDRIYHHLKWIYLAVTDKQPYLKHMVFDAAL